MKGLEGLRTEFIETHKVENVFREKYRTYEGQSIIEGTKGQEIANDFATFDDNYDNHTTIRRVCDYFFEHSFDEAPDTIREINHLNVDRNPYATCTAHFTKVKYIILTKEHGNNRVNMLKQLKEDDIISPNDYLLLERFKLITDKFIDVMNTRGKYWLDIDSQHIEGQLYMEDQKYEKYDKSTLDLRVCSQYHKDRLYNTVKLDTYRTSFFIDESFPTYAAKAFKSIFFNDHPILKGVLFVANVYTRKNLIESEAHWLGSLIQEGYDRISDMIIQGLLEHFQRPQGGAIHTQQERQARIASNNYWLQRLLAGKVDLPTLISVLNIKPIGRTPKESLKKYVLKQRSKGLLEWDLFRQIYIYCQRKY